MAGVSVNIDSLKRVKRAISDFQTDLEKVTDKITSSTEQVLIEVRQSVKKQEDNVATLDNIVSKLAHEIETIQNNIIVLNSRISSLKNEIANLENQIPQLQVRISQLENQKCQLEAERREMQGDTSYIDAKIREVEEQIQSNKKTLYQLTDRISCAKKEQAENEKRSFELKELKSKKDNELIIRKNELKKAKDKLERMNAARNSVERDIANLIIAVHKFEQMTTASNTTSINGVEKCIAIIEEYLSTNLESSGGSGLSSGNGETTNTVTTSHSERNYPYSKSDEIPDDIYKAIRGYQENPEWNQIIRAGDSTPEIDKFRTIINQNQLSETAHFTRRASLADLGPNLQNMPLEELTGHSYPFVGIMSASGSQSMADMVSSGNVIYEITAPAGTSALDLTNLSDFQEIMFDSPVCHIDSAEMCGYNTIRLNVTIE